MSRRLLSSLRTAAVLALASTTVAVAADRVRRHGTPPGRPAPAGFAIRGSVTGSLRPGVSVPLRLTLRNPHSWPLRVDRLSVEITVDKAHARAGCDRFVHYRVGRLPARAYPLLLPPLSNRSLPQLGVPFGLRLRMLDLPTNQDACQGARLALRFAGRSTRAGRALAR